MKWTATVLLALALSAAPAPKCSEVQSVTAVLDGQYAAVACPEGTLTVSVGAQQAMPQVGAASVRKWNRAYVLVAGGQRYPISRGR